MGILQTRCNGCLTEAKFSNRWKAAYCPKCMKWLTGKCALVSQNSSLKREYYFEWWNQPKRPTDDEPR